MPRIFHLVYYIFCICLLILVWFSTLDDDACAQDTDDNAVPNGLDDYDTPEGFEMVCLYCVQFYMLYIVFRCHIYVYILMYLIELTVLKPYRVFMYQLWCRLNCNCIITQRLYDSMTL